MIVTVLQLGFFLLMPTAALWLQKRTRVVAVMGSVALCYVIGFAIGNTPCISFDSGLAIDTSSAADVLVSSPSYLFFITLGPAAFGRILKPRSPGIRMRRSSKAPGCGLVTC